MVGANTGHTEVADPIAIATAYVEMWNTQDDAEIPNLVSETFVMYDPGAPADGVPGPKREVHGQDGLRQFMEGVTTAYPDFEISMGKLLADDTVAMYEARLTGTHDGMLFGLPPTGRRVDIHLVSKLTLEDGVVSEHRVYFDMQEVLEQLGLTFPTVIGQLPKLVVGKVRASL